MFLVQKYLKTSYFLHHSKIALQCTKLKFKTCFSICLQIIIMYLQILESQTNTLLAQQAWYVLKHHSLYFVC